MWRVTHMMTRDVAKVKNSNNDDIFHFFLEYQQANEQRDEQERGIAHIRMRENPLKI
jgi:hypothetical protein